MKATDPIIEYLEENQISMNNIDRVYQQILHDYKANDLVRGVIGDLAYYERQLVLIRAEQTILLIKKANGKTNY